MSGELTLAVQKRALRTRAKMIASAISPEENAALSAALCAALAALPEFAAARTVCCFAGMEDEPDTRAFLTETLRRGKRLCLPRVLGGGELALCAVERLDSLEAGAFGILEPPAAAPCLPPREVDLCVVPCLAGSADGRRLGRGGGYYDRLLARLRPDAKTVLACRKALLLAHLPVGPQDAACDLVVTEEGALR